jgi:cytochrome c-type biogenesis protein CcmH
MSIWIALALLATLAMAPLGLVLGNRATARGRRDAAIALHRAQLAELDRDLDEGRIAAAEHATARLEVQRRLLAAADTPDTQTRARSPMPLVAALLLVPAAAIGLYLVTGSPGMPSAPFAARQAEAQKQNQEMDRMVAQLQERLAKLDPHALEARQGYVLLGNVEANRGNLAAAAAAWQSALAASFDPTIAVETAEALTRANGHVTPEAAALFRRALDAAPRDAPWREAAEARLASAGDSK